MTVTIVYRPEMGDECRVDHHEDGLLVETGREVSVIRDRLLEYSTAPAPTRCICPTCLPTRGALPSLPDPV